MGPRHTRLVERVCCLQSLQGELISSNHSCSCVFGDERGKITTEDDANADEDWTLFKRRRAGRKAAAKAVEARIRLITSAQGFLLSECRCREAD
jgi:hypothetical protein